MVRLLFEQSKTQAAFSGTAAFDEPMSGHTTFNIGGPADLYLRPAADCFIPYSAALLRLARAGGIPVYILGGGANLLVSDAGVRGVVLDTGSWTGLMDGEAGRAARRGPDGAAIATFRAGTPMDEAVRWAQERALAGLEDFAGLPGTIGGALWMNARCYESEAADTLTQTILLDERLAPVTEPADHALFSYKQSPFQGRRALILGASFALKPGDKTRIAQKTRDIRADRERKGHFRFPSAGSVFKNNRAHERPAGKIIEELNLRGTRSGGAQIAPWHGNFIINTGGATADDVRHLIALAQERAYKAFGISLECEVLFIA
jgi:UDP-N-acetylmuramate dehydrogenase